MSTEETTGRALSEDEQRRARHDAHLEQRRAIGARARAEARLQEAFERDLITLDGLESRLAQINKARTSAEVDAALVDVPELAAVVEVEAAADTRALAVVGEVPRRAWAVAVLGGTSRKGPWTVPRKLRAVAVMGGCELDFTQARFGAVTDVHCVALMGGIEIKVPPGVRVESNGVGILGGFEHGADAPAVPGQPVLRIHGAAIMGGVDIRAVERE